MDNELRILMLEDVPADAELMEHELHNAGIAFTSKHVENRAGFLRALEEFAPDIVLSDYVLPGFDGMAALQLVQERTPSIPVIIVTGSMNEETAVECMKAGAADYVLKEHLIRIGPSVRAALEKKRVREEKEQVDEAIRVSARQWRTTFDAISDAICLLDAEGKVLRCNRAMADFLGQPFTEIIGSTCWELVHGACEPIEDCPYKRVQKSHRRETTVLPVDRRWLKVTVDPLLDEADRLIGAVHIVSDITDQVHAEETLTKQRAELCRANAILEEKNRLLSASHQIGQVILSSLELDEVLEALGKSIIEVGIFRSLMIALVDEPTQSVEVVQAQVRSIDYTSPILPGSEEGVGRRYSLDDVNITAEVARTGQMQVIEGWDDRFDPLDKDPERYKDKLSYFIPVKKEDRTIVVLATGSRIAEKEEMLQRIQMIGPLLDEVAIAVEHAQLFQEVQATQQKLKEYSENLEELVEERTRALRETQEQLMRKEKLAVLGQLAGGVGHELRNPLSAIKNAAYFLNMVFEDPDPEVKEMLGILQEEVSTSERIITSLLDFARQKPPTRREVKINDVLYEALSRITVPDPIEVVIHLDESLPVLLSDPDQLLQVFGNLLLNAIQAMPEGGRLTVTSQRRGDPVGRPEGVAVSFSDTGMGMSVEQQGKIFEALYTTKAKGIGLGLSLTKMLVESHGGTIEVHSAVGEGSTFTVRLPHLTG